MPKNCLPLFGDRQFMGRMGMWYAPLLKIAVLFADESTGDVCGKKSVVAAWVDFRVGDE